jgi:hypothetical protein
MKGAIVFLVFFALFLVVTIGYPGFPPGSMIYDAFFPGTRDPLQGYTIAGIDAVTLISGIFNGVIYGVIAWLFYSLMMAVFGKKKEVVNQTVNINVSEKKDSDTQGKATGK